MQYIERIPEPERPPMANGKEYANDRGSRIHDDCENFVRGKGPFTDEMKHFEAEFGLLAAHYAVEPEAFIMEDMWALNRDWAYAKGKDDTWVRIIVDCMVKLTPTHALVVDYKSGRKYGNEVKHGQQVQLYQLAAFLLFPELEHVTAELWYLDQDEMTSMKFTRAQGMRYLKYFEDKGVAITTATEFPAKPSRNACFFCPYKTGTIGKNGPEGTGDCTMNP